MVIVAYLLNSLKLTDAYNNSRPKKLMLCAYVCDYYNRMVAHNNIISLKPVKLQVMIVSTKFQFIRMLNPHKYGILLFILTSQYNEIREISKNYNSITEIFYININYK